MKVFRKYKDFRMVENMSMAKSIVSKKMQDFENLKTLLSKNIGYIGKFTEYLFKEDIPYSELENTYKDLVEIKSKNHAINISDMNHEKCVDEIQKKKDTIIINSVVSQFPRKQKDLIKSEIKSSHIRNAILKIADKDIKAFVSKISRYHSLSALTDAMKIYAKDSNNKRDEVLKMAEDNKDTNVVYNEGDILILHVKKHSAIEIFGSDTSWCIVSSDYYWKQYIKYGKQLILYNYSKDEMDPKFKVGITIKRDGGIYAAHDILDKGMSGEINDLLAYHNIDKNKILSEIYKDVVDNNEEIKLRSSTSKAKLLYKIPQLSKEELIKWFNTIMRWSKTDTYKVDIGRTVVDAYFKDYPYVTEEMVAKVNENFPMFMGNAVETRRKWVSKTRFFSTSVSLSASYKAMQDGYWSNIDIANCVERQDILNNFIGTTKVSNKEYAEKVTDKLNEVFNTVTYEQTKLDGASVSNPNKKGIKLSVSFEALMVIMNLALDRDISKIGGDVSKYFEQIRESEQHRTILQHKLYFTKVPVELNTVYNIAPENVKYIIKKDYDKPYSLPGTSYLRQGMNQKQIDIFKAIVDHMKGYKFIVKVSRDILKKIRDNRNNFDYPIKDLGTKAVEIPLLRKDTKIVVDNITFIVY